MMETAPAAAAVVEKTEDVREESSCLQKVLNEKTSWIFFTNKQGNERKLYNELNLMRF